MRELKANTQVKVVIGPFVDVGDGFTPETAITLGAADEAELMKHDAAAVTDISGATWAAITNMDGYYNLTLTTSHTDTEGMIVIAVQDDSVCLPVRAEFMVLSQAAYDSKYAAKDAGFMDVNIKTIGRADTQETEADNLESACSNYSATRGLSGTALPAAAADGIGGLPISDAGGLDLDTILDVAISTRLAPTTASRTLDVTAGGAAGIDWGNVENKTTANDLSATDIQLCDTVTTNTDAITVADILTTAMTEAYAADGAAPTLAQAIFLIQQSLHEFAISSTTRTVKKLDGTTTAATFTLDDATSPTSTTRAT